MTTYDVILRIETALDLTVLEGAPISVHLVSVVPLGSDIEANFEDENNQPWVFF